MNTSTATVETIIDRALLRIVSAPSSALIDCSLTGSFCRAAGKAPALSTSTMKFISLFREAAGDLARCR